MDEEIKENEDMPIGFFIFLAWMLGYPYVGMYEVIYNGMTMNRFMWIWGGGMLIIMFGGIGLWILILELKSR